jgi:chorismate mutase/prephenate dehydratase
MDEAHSPSPADGVNDLAELRQKIDALDTQLIELLSRRGELAQQIGRRKAADGCPVYAPDRESEILQRLCRENPGPFPDAVLLAIYRELMSGSFALERSPRIAYLGPVGSYSHLAALRKFGSAADYEPVDDIPAVFAEVERGHVDLAVVPVESALGGGVAETLTAFIRTPVKVCAEIRQRIRQNLLGHRPLGEIRRVYSKPEAFAQCKRWLQETGLLSRTVPTASTSRAAELAATEEGAAAIGSVLAAELYHLPIQVADIEDDPQNVTRFLVLSRAAAQPTGADKTALLFSTAHRAGALVDVLNAFREQQVNLTMIVSIPSRQNAWEYFFFVEADGHADDPTLRSALERARPLCTYLSVLGSYPRPTDVL